VTKDEYLRRVAAAHRRWSKAHGDTVKPKPGDANPHDGQQSDIGLWNADRSAPPRVDDELNAELMALTEEYRGV
jgi:hypothetical protein